MREDAVRGSGFGFAGYVGWLGEGVGEGDVYEEGRGGEFVGVDPGYGCGEGGLLEWGEGVAV